MESIISPWFIYLLSIIGAIKGTFITVAVVSGLIALSSGVGYWIMKTDRKTDRELNEAWLPVWKSLFKPALWIFVPFLLFGIIVPDKKTLIWMIVAKNVTYQNVGKAIEAGADFKNELKKDMIEIIESIKGEEKSE